MENFYWIKIVDLKGKKSYVIETPEGNVDIEDTANIASIMKFQNYTTARQFARTNKLENKKTKVYIREALDFLTEMDEQEIEVLGQNKKKKQ